MKLDIQTTKVVVNTRKWNILVPSIAIAQGVTENGRSVCGIGSSNLSHEAALNNATDDIKINAQVDVNFSFRLQYIESRYPPVRVEFLENRGEIRKTNMKNSGTLGVGSDRSPKLGVIGIKNGRSVDAEVKIQKTRVKKLVKLPDYSSTLTKALDKVSRRFDRTGEVQL